MLPWDLVKLLDEIDDSLIVRRLYKNVYARVFLKALKNHVLP